LSTPIGGSPDTKLSAHIGGRLRDNSVIAAYEEFNRNVGVKLKVSKSNQYGQRQLIHVYRIDLDAYIRASPSMDIMILDTMQLGGIL
jgi:hypothetical protein